MHLTPDSIVYWQNGIVVVNATLVNTWLVMVVLTAGSWLATRHLTPTGAASRWQTALETIVTLIEGQIGEIAGRHARRYLSFVGTLFLLIVCANLLSIVPGYRSPTGSLSTTAALAGRLPITDCSVPGRRVTTPPRPLTSVASIWAPKEATSRSTL